MVLYLHENILPRFSIDIVCCSIGFGIGEKTHRDWRCMSVWDMESRNRDSWWHISNWSLIRCVYENRVVGIRTLPRPEGRGLSSHMYMHFIAILIYKWGTWVCFALWENKPRFWVTLAALTHWYLLLNLFPSFFVFNVNALYSSFDKSQWMGYPNRRGMIMCARATCLTREKKISNRLYTYLNYIPVLPITYSSPLIKIPRV